MMELEELQNRKRINWKDITKFDLSDLAEDIVKSKCSRQVLWHLINSVTEIPSCQMCSNKVKWHKSERKYLDHCSIKCAGRNKKTKEKIHQTNFERYGGYLTRTEKRIKTNLERYGVENPFQSDEIKERIKQTNLERYGVENPSQSKEIQNRKKQTNIRNHGVEYYTNRKKAEQTNLERYDCEIPFQVPEFRQKRNQIIFDRYGVKSHKQKHFDEKVKNILFNEEAFGEFIREKSPRKAAQILDIDVGTIWNYIEKYSVTDYVQPTKSYLEDEMSELLTENNINFIQNTKQIITPLELDFYLPDHNLAIEMNGEYWHSNEMILQTRGMTADEYHQMKTDKCKEQGIELIHISESEWNDSTSKLELLWN